MSRLLRRALSFGLAFIGACGLVPAVAGAGEWTTYHHDNLRSGDAAIKGTFTKIPTPRWSWSVPGSQGLGARDLYSEPLIAKGLVIVTSDSNWIYALRVEDGSLAWKVQVGPPEVPKSSVCGDVQTASQPTIGITSTPVIDEARNEIYAVAAIGTGAGAHTPVRHLFGVDLTTGTVEFDRAVEPQPTPNPYLLQRPGLAETSDGKIIIGFGGNDGDCGDYHGWIESVAGSGTRPPVDRYEVSPDGWGGAVWMGGGAPTIAPDGSILVADGNGEETNCSGGTPPAYDHSDAVLRLSESMTLDDFFAPGTWLYDNCNDLDLGSGQPQLLSSGLVLQIGKTHLGYILDESSLGHIVSSPTTFAVCPGGIEAGGAAVISQSSTSSTLAVPCTDGIQSVTVTKGTPSTGTVNWQSSATGPPILVGGKLVSLSNDTLSLIDPATGNVLDQSYIGNMNNHFETAAAGDGILVAAGSRRVVAYAPNAP
jgi:outer membrane protein assembly factor BamB